MIFCLKVYSQEMYFMGCQKTLKKKIANEQITLVSAVQGKLMGLCTENFLSNISHDYMINQPPRRYNIQGSPILFGNIIYQFFEDYLMIIVFLKKGHGEMMACAVYLSSYFII